MLTYLVIVVLALIVLGELIARWRSAWFRASPPSPAPLSTDPRSSHPAPAAPLLSGNEYELWTLQWEDRLRRSVGILPLEGRSGTGTRDASAAPATNAPAASGGGTFETNEDRRRLE